jgi:hypothetical protein
MDAQNYETSINFCKKLDIPIKSEVIPLYKERFERSINYFKSLIPLLFNCIFYLIQYPEHIEDKFPKEVPAGLLHKYDSAPDLKRKQKIYQEISNHGLSKIKFVTSIIDKKEIGNKTDRELNTHWRRGHWRNQPIGEGRIGKKYIWIHPTIVRKDKSSPLGHIYEV